MKTAEAIYLELKQGSLDPNSFTHSKHIRLAWFYLNRWDGNEAIERFTNDLQEYLRQLGADNKYHHTISVALLQLIASHFPGLDDPQDWLEFKQDAKPLFTDARQLMQRYYSDEQLNSTTARNHWVEADIKPLPGYHDFRP
ncbi:MAG: hypothetical protein IMF09_07085 [Proteobacteria bacterium]|nr:hypothetical protein [Pseudomonadota bacterium]